MAAAEGGGNVSSDNSPMASACPSVLAAHRRRDGERADDQVCNAEDLTARTAHHCAAPKWSCGAFRLAGTVDQRTR